MNKNLIQGLFIVLAIVALFVSPTIALFAGIIFALVFGNVFQAYASKTASYLLKVAVVGLGLGMNLIDSLQSSADGIIFTIVSVVMVMFVGVGLSMLLGVEKRLGYLISSGTAICGGSAIAAVGPVVNAKSNDMSISLAVVFTLNGIAMFLFPTLGHLLDLSQSDFGMWAAIAIHDTSAVVGAAKEYGSEALEIATTIKLSRALWIIPLSLVSVLVFKKDNQAEGVEKKAKIKIPWFIFLFILAMVANTYLPIPAIITDNVKLLSYAILSLTLFLIGSGLSVSAIKNAGFKPILLGVLLWILISVVTLGVILII